MPVTYDATGFHATVTTDFKTPQLRLFVSMIPMEILTGTNKTNKANKTTQNTTTNRPKDSTRDSSNDVYDLILQTFEKTEGFVASDSHKITGALVPAWVFTYETIEQSTAALMKYNHKPHPQNPNTLFLVCYFEGKGDLNRSRSAAAKTKKD